MILCQHLPPIPQRVGSSLKREASYSFILEPILRSENEAQKSSGFQVLTAKASGEQGLQRGLHASPTSAPAFQSHLPISAGLISQPGIFFGNSPGPGRHGDWV